MTSENEVKVIRYSTPPPLPDRFFFGGGGGGFLVGFSFGFLLFFCMKLIFFDYHVCHSNLNTTFKK